MGRPTVEDLCIFVRVQNSGNLDGFGFGLARLLVIESICSFMNKVLT